MDTCDPGSPTTLSLTIPARPENLAYCRLALTAVAQRRGIDSAVLADLKLAVTEACSNAIRHAYTGGEGEVSLRLVIDRDSISVEVEDAGRGFAPPGEPAGPAERRESGMGLALIRALTDKLVVSAGPDGRGCLVSFRRDLAVRRR